ncbi:MAG: hypothetical protein AAGG38_04345 [Planctomycetota bacterium]
MAMDPRDPRLRQAMAEIAMGLPGIFESPQWGGWVYKCRGAGGSTRSSGGAKMLCFVVEGKNHGWHCQFKLPGRDDEGRAAEAVKKWAWIEAHPWKTLGPSGWVVARPRTPAQFKTLADLLAESRTLLPENTAAESTAPDHAARGGGATSEVARRMAAVMREAHEGGWAPRDPDAAAFGE